MANGDNTKLKQTTGAWIVHHGQKVTAVNGSAEFPALATAAKAASLLSQLAATENTTVGKNRVEALAKAARLNPKIELPTLLQILQTHRLIERSDNDDIIVLGLTSRATLQHASDIFFDQGPTPEEKATIILAEKSSNAPLPHLQAMEYIGDTCKMSKHATHDFLLQSEQVGFVDAEGNGVDKLYFNGNLFRRNNIDKVKRVLDSLSTEEQNKVIEIKSLLERCGCVGITKIEHILGIPLFEKLKAAGMYDVNNVSNSSGENGFVTLPSAFHKFTDPLIDDAFDLAKALVAALTYGMTQSGAGRGRITMLQALLNKLISGSSVGPATAIGEDYKILEFNGVIRVTPSGELFCMRLLKRDIGEIALKVLTTGEAASDSVLDRPLPGQMSGYSGPEQNRTDFRRKQTNPGRKHTHTVLNALRTEGGLS